METKWLNETTLQGDTVTLLPLSLKHRDRLVEAAKDGKLWELWYTTVPSENEIDNYIETAFQQYKEDSSLPFVVLHNKTQKIIGSTRFLNANSKVKRVEIGSTWYAKSFQRTAVNTECKLLLLQYAFENLKCIAVELRTHFHNQKSRRAIANLGAKQDGILRNHTIDKVGNLRDTVVFSILNSEWNVVKTALSYRLNQ
ncbi:GNAT family N-acetyltransferase [Flammeovirga sp. EKP202]|uniref:GNAT family N-acetyltransferase n=1 Tax=Flammeovirga sp. EKP202 TaxID=2770592 RepID=UPI00165F485A|nr:GNAT family protein [Flammeovirga sp. EKP202]MBD0404363.1 GNAT family N-acetyltransferase [Flammeovirga sp. EKP202]